MDHLVVGALRDTLMLEEGLIGPKAANYHWRCLYPV